MGNHTRHSLKVFTGNAHPALAREICKDLGVSLGKANIDRFPDGEVRLQIQENVRGTDVFVIQPTCSPVNENLMELLIMLDAFRRASANRITAVMKCVRIKSDRGHQLVQILIGFCSRRRQRCLHGKG